MYPGNVSLARTYLEDRVTSGRLSNYSLCLAAYALVLANSPVAGTALTELSRRADYRGKNSCEKLFPHLFGFNEILKICMFSLRKKKQQKKNIRMGTLFG